jgi:hypothetical protein
VLLAGGWGLAALGEDLYPIYLYATLVSVGLATVPGGTSWWRWRPGLASGAGETKYDAAGAISVFGKRAFPGGAAVAAGAPRDW